MQYNHLDIVNLDGGMYIVKNAVTKKYVKVGSREVNYLLQCIGCECEEFDFSKESELDQDEKTFMYQKFDEWGFLNEGSSEGKDSKSLTLQN